jgi:hypothetical protein
MIKIDVNKLHSHVIIKGKILSLTNFLNYDDQFYVDTIMKLMWTNYSYPLENYEQALNNVKACNAKKGYAGVVGWRLPGWLELSRIPSGMSDIKRSSYWTRATRIDKVLGQQELRVVCWNFHEGQIVALDPKELCYARLCRDVKDGDFEVG